MPGAPLLGSRRSTRSPRRATSARAWRRPCSRISGSLCSPAAHAMRHGILPAGTDPSSQPRTRGTDMAGVYVQTNEASANRLLAFGRRDDGTLDPRGAVETGGRGDGVLHLTSGGSVVLAGGGRHLLVTNSGSGDVSLLALGDGPPQLLGTLASGPAPKSVAAHGDLVYVLNTGDASLAGFWLGNGGLLPLSGSRRQLGAGADPAQVGFSPDGSKLVVTQRGTDELAVFAVDADGRLSRPHV